MEIHKNTQANNEQGNWFDLFFRHFAPLLFSFLSLHVSVLATLQIDEISGRSPFCQAVRPGVGHYFASSLDAKIAPMNLKSVPTYKICVLQKL